MELTKKQLSELISKHAERENGMQDIMQIVIEAMMVSERREYLHEEGLPGNKCNGFRPGRTYGHGSVLTFKIPRDRFGNFYPQVLAFLRNQEEECNLLAGALYSKGLTQQEVGEIFGMIYGEQYSKSSICRMIDGTRKAVAEWLERSLEKYYPIVFVDCIHLKVHRSKSVDTEAFYVVLAVTDDKTREVLGIYNKPVESAQGWGEMLNDLRERGVDSIGLICADGLRGLENVVCDVFTGTPLQRCTTHLKRAILSDVRVGDREAVAEDLKDVFRAGDRDYTFEMAWVKWERFCEKWGFYRSIKKRGVDPTYKAYFTYLNYDYRIQSMIYTTNWIERLQKDFRRVTRMRGAMPNEDSVIVLMGKTAMDKKAYMRQVPRIGLDKKLFPDG